MPQHQPLGVSTLPDDVIEKILTQNFIVALAGSQASRRRKLCTQREVRHVLAESIISNPKTNAPDLIDCPVLRDFILGMVSSDGDFLAVSALALLTRYGADDEKGAELEQLAGGLNIPLDRLKAASQKLEDQGLLTKHGRYRAGVGPHPLAVLLASGAWEQLGDQIVGTLLPTLDASMAERLFLRAADLGSRGPAAVALDRLLEPGGPLRIP